MIRVNGANTRMKGKRTAVPQAPRDADRISISKCVRCMFRDLLSLVWIVDILILSGMGPENQEGSSKTRELFVRTPLVSSPLELKEKQTVVNSSKRMYALLAHANVESDQGSDGAPSNGSVRGMRVRRHNLMGRLTTGD
ncbi:hypothetical protein C8J57DRAFT_1241270 [Mycena rebaudengoi]|nr:hypothetical protein C8J57DRAFT_1241270 [Mycena rebaudengoi]